MMKQTWFSWPASYVHRMLTLAACSILAVPIFLALRPFWELFEYSIDVLVTVTSITASATLIASAYGTPKPLPSFSRSASVGKDLRAVCVKAAWLSSVGISAALVAMFCVTVFATRYELARFRYLVPSGETVAEVALRFGLSPSIVLAANGLEEDPGPFAEGREVLIPGGSSNPKVTTLSFPVDVTLSWPTYGPIFAYFSAWHRGIDISPRYGTLVYASGSGRVVEVQREDWGLGWYVIIDHGQEVRTLYGHLSEIKVVEGEDVPSGQQIGRTGTTGSSSYPQVHFEVRYKGIPIDPRRFVSSHCEFETPGGKLRLVAGYTWELNGEQIGGSLVELAGGKRGFVVFGGEAFGPKPCVPEFLLRDRDTNAIEMVDGTRLLRVISRPK